MYTCFDICILVVLFHISCATASYSLCGDWQTYANEKCIKILDSEKLETFEEGIKSCSKIDNNSEILTIHSKEEQDFISEYLFKTHKLVENVWIGLRNRSGHFEWTDNSNIQYNNWRAGSPTNKLDFNCVQLELDSSQWTNVPCLKKNLVVCQKLPEVTLSDLLKRLKKTEEDINEVRSELDKKSKNVSKVTQNVFNQIFNIVFNNKLSHYQLFTDVDGKNKAFIIPLSAITRSYIFESSLDPCKNFNSTLIEIQSLEKQIILESFLGRLGFQSNQFQWFWINAKRDSSGKWKWLNSNKELTFTNWYTGEPKTNPDYDYIYVETSSNETFGKWHNYPNAGSCYVICEYTFEF